MSTKKSAVDELKGALINVSLDRGGRGDTFQFVIGEVAKPDWDVVRTVLNKTYQLGYAKDLLGSEDDASTLAWGNKEQLEYYVPLMCRLIDNALVLGKYEAALHPQLIAIAYILAWYWHFNLGGPRPIFEPKRYHKKTMVRIEWRCPVCTREYEPPKNLVRIEAKYNAYVKWLNRHGVEYHKEWKNPNGTRTGRSKKSA